MFYNDFIMKTHKKNWICKKLFRPNVPFGYAFGCLNEQFCILIPIQLAMDAHFADSSSAVVLEILENILQITLLQFIIIKQMSFDYFPEERKNVCDSCWLTRAFKIISNIFAVVIKQFVYHTTKSF